MWRFRDSEEETKYIRKYAKENEFPSYETIETKIRERVELYAEFERFNYHCLRKIWENIGKGRERKIKKYGEKIHDVGGFEALQKNFYIFLVSLGEICTREAFIIGKAVIKQGFQGIGSWKN